MRPALRLVTIGLTAVACFCLAPRPAAAGTGDFRRTLANPKPSSNDGFGFALATFGSQLLVGSVGEAVSGISKAGVVYRLDVANGNVLATIPNPTPDANDFFGRWIDANDQRIVVGTYLDDDAGFAEAGAAYSFDALTGALVHTFYDPNPGADERFGTRVALVGDDVLVGSYKDNTLGPLRGAAYLYSGLTGQLVRTLYDPTPANGDRFGYFVDSFRGNPIVSAYRDSELGAEVGAVFIFDRVSGDLVRKINNPVPINGALFGYSLDVDRHLVAVGARDASFLSGNAYVFDGLTGERLFRVLDPFGKPYAEFGASLLIVDDTVVVGSPGADEEAGEVLIFDGPTGRLMKRIYDPTPNPGERFGSRLARIGDEIFVSSPNDLNEAGLAVGSVHVFEAALPRLPGDADRDGSVGAGDYTAWAAQFGRTRSWLSADFNADGTVGSADYAIWAANFGSSPASAVSVPEPGGASLLGVGLGIVAWARGRRGRR